MPDKCLMYIYLHNHIQEAINDRDFLNYCKKNPPACARIWDAAFGFADKI